jgi:transposase
VTRRFDLTDAQWAVLEPLLPQGKKPGRPPKWSKRQLIDGIRWRVRVGAPWRDVPDCYGPWQTVYGLFRRWQRAGVRQRIVTGLQTRADAAGLITWDVSVDSTIARAHQHAAGARTQPEAQKEPPGGADEEPADHALGRSRGGLTTKLHLGCEQGQKPLAMLLTAGQRGDSPQFTRVLERIRVPRPGGGRPRTRPDRVLADKAYSSRANRAELRRRAGEDPKPQHVADRHPEPFDRAAGHLEPGGRHAELAGHEVHRDRRQLARMPREPALDLEELQHQRQAQPAPAGAAKGPHRLPLAAGHSVSWAIH